MVSREFCLTFRILRKQIVDMYLRTSGSSEKEISIIRNTLYTNGINKVHTISKIFTRLKLSGKKDVYIVQYQIHIVYKTLIMEYNFVFLFHKIIIANVSRYRVNFRNNS